MFRFQVTKRSAISVLSLLVLVGAFVLPVKAEYPKPSPYPLSWELKWEGRMPRRVVVQAPGEHVSRAYWYIMYTVTNNTKSEQIFYPRLEMLSSDGNVVRSDHNISLSVFDTIKKREGAKFLLDANQIGGELRLGADEAKDGVAIWPEPNARMGHFTVFVTGLSGEAVTVKGPDGKDAILRKTMAVNYHVPGDEIYPGEDPVYEKDTDWVMR